MTSTTAGTCVDLDSCSPTRPFNCEERRAVVNQEMRPETLAQASQAAGLEAGFADRAGLRHEAGSA